jgi:hypothetical protein
MLVKFKQTQSLADLRDLLELSPAAKSSSQQSRVN